MKQNQHFIFHQTKHFICLEIKSSLHFHGYFCFLKMFKLHYVYLVMKYHSNKKKICFVLKMLKWNYLIFPMFFQLKPFAKFGLNLWIVSVDPKLHFGGQMFFSRVVSIKFVTFSSNLGSLCNQRLLCQLLAQQGFKVVSVRGACYSPCPSSFKAPPFSLMPGCTAWLNMPPVQIKVPYRPVTKMFQQVEYLCRWSAILSCNKSVKAGYNLSHNYHVNSAINITSVKDLREINIISFLIVTDGRTAFTYLSWDHPGSIWKKQK